MGESFFRADARAGAGAGPGEQQSGLGVGDLVMGAGAHQRGEARDAFSSMPVTSGPEQTPLAGESEAFHQDPKYRRAQSVTKAMLLSTVRLASAACSQAAVGVPTSSSVGRRPIHPHVVTGGRIVGEGGPRR
ncbi:hypothetical protein G3I31_22555 [Streptomyces sp. SID9913]|uniref:Uncharacterized protein n=2 Tax=unclassified Streptomyces TaxID=2593676 RepID=A0A6G3QUS4_9ACTN|nr:MULTISPECIES: hypothetical protein [unclassified Streptomyces]NEA87111.1 hypothetical protein [Streptomyces sp. SID14436]NEC80149.1 hypothetical protein [Streptomyces sp. SID7958]NED20823.1 hypothetical protein [Streptomyces sp. SID9913]